MINLETTRKKYTLGHAILWMSGIIWTLLLAAIDYQEHPIVQKFPLLRASTDWTNSNLIELTLSTAIFFVFGKLLSRKQKSICWSALKAQLNTLQRYVCTNSGNEIHDNNRVTLFRYKKICVQAVRVKSFASMWKDGCWPWTGWLVPVLRSGHTSQNTNALFWVPDDGRKSEGIAGQCWSQNNTVYIDKLPNVNSNTSLSNRDKYARKSNMPIDMVKRYIDNSRPLARSIMAIPLLDSSSELWGVVVVDSVSGDGIDTKQAMEAFKFIADTIGELVGELR